MKIIEFIREFPDEQHCKMKVLPNHLKETINTIIERSIESTSTVVSDKSYSYVDISKIATILMNFATN